MPRFDPERIAATRLVLTLTGIVSLVAMSVGIKDYLKAKPPVGASTPTGVYSDAKKVPKKSTSAKTRQARMSATEANAPWTEQAADNIEKPLIRKEFAKAGAKAIVAIDTVPNTAQAAKDEIEATPEECLPLPNGTKPGDVDAAYYQNWARAYGCLFLPDGSFRRVPLRK